VRSLLRVFRISAASALLAGLVALVTAVAPAVSASAATSTPAAGGVGWVRCAHLSPNTPAVDVYMYAFGSTANPVILRHVSYGNVSDYMSVKAGQYTVAMRAAGAAPSSTPVLSTSFSVAAGKSYTVAGMGPASGLRLQVFDDQLTAPAGKTLVRVIQASLKEHQVTVSYGSDTLAKNLAFASSTSYQPLAAGSGTVKFSSSGADASAPAELSADTVHTIVVLDGASGLKVDTLTDAAGSQVAASGGAAMGFGGTAPQPLNSLPWLATMAAGVLLALGGWASLRRTRTARGGATR
jgi:Domain of unknown function (DUF4397)